MHRRPALRVLERHVDAPRALGEAHFAVGAPAPREVLLVVLKLRGAIGLESQVLLVDAVDIVVVQLPQGGARALVE